MLRGEEGEEAIAARRAAKDRLEVVAGGRAAVAQPMPRELPKDVSLLRGSSSLPAIVGRRG